MITVEILSESFSLEKLNLLNTDVLDGVRGGCGSLSVLIQSLESWSTYRVHIMNCCHKIRKCGLQDLVRSHSSK